MSFSTDLAKLASDQLARFVTPDRHQLAGRLASLDFWLARVRHALDALDGYGVRFVHIESAQKRHVDVHGVS
jgi:hypothetical protein